LASREVALRAVLAFVAAESAVGVAAQRDCKRAIKTRSRVPVMDFMMVIFPGKRLGRE
jgi:hypothetical protein